MPVESSTSPAERRFFDPVFVPSEESPANTQGVLSAIENAFQAVSGATGALPGSGVNEGSGGGIDGVVSAIVDVVDEVNEAIVESIPTDLLESIPTEVLEKAEPFLREYALSPLELNEKRASVEEVANMIEKASSNTDYAQYQYDGHAQGYSMDTDSGLPDGVEAPSASGLPDRVEALSTILVNSPNPQNSIFDPTAQTSLRIEAGELGV